MTAPARKLVAEMARNRIAERKVNAKMRSIGIEPRVSLRYRYFRHAHPRASILVRRPAA